MFEESIILSQEQSHWNLTISPILTTACLLIPANPKIFHIGIHILVTFPEAIRTCRESFCLLDVVPSLFHYHTFERTINLRKSILQMDSQSLPSVERATWLPWWFPMAAIPWSKHLRWFPTILIWSAGVPGSGLEQSPRTLSLVESSGCGTLFFGW